MTAVTREAVEAMQARDAACSATWFTGPPSCTAMAIRDRRELLALLTALWDRCEAAEGAIKAHNDSCVSQCEAYGEKRCLLYKSRNRLCPDCPKYELIDTAIGRGEQRE